ncbi:MAG: lysophospholipid acyltransferase family protein [Pseudomonadota bacterium]
MLSSLRALAFQASFIVWTIGLCLVMLPVAPFTSGAGFRGWARFWEGGVLWLLRRVVGIALLVRGAPPAEPVLIAAKHQSVLETLVFHRLVPNVAVPLKQELTRIPLFGRYLVKAGCIPVDRGAGAAAMRWLFRDAEARVAEGLSLLVFPEGTRVRVGETGAYRPGIAGLYLALGRPVVPVALLTGHVWGRGFLGKRPGTAVIAFLEPIEPGLDRRQFMRLLEERIETASAALAAEFDAPRTRA